MYQDYKDLLSGFQSHGVKYLIVGGFAVIYHAQPRFTRHLDLFIKADPANAKATYHALVEFGVSLHGIRPDDFTDRNNFFRFGGEPKGFDILPDIPGVDFDKTCERRIETVVDEKTGLRANFICADYLIASKLASGRRQDFADADAVTQAQRLRPAKQDTPGTKPP